YALRFPGHYLDEETGLFYNRFRYYSPRVGRYLQSDPIGQSGGTNLYAYPANPLVDVDVLGLVHREQYEDFINNGHPVTEDTTPIDDSTHRYAAALQAEGPLPQPQGTPQGKADRTALFQASLPLRPPVFGSQEDAAKAALTKANPD